MLTTQVTICIIAEQLHSNDNGFCYMCFCGGFFRNCCYFLFKDEFDITHYARDDRHHYFVFMPGVVAVKTYLPSDMNSKEIPFLICVNRAVSGLPIDSYN